MAIDEDYLARALTRRAAETKLNYEKSIEALMRKNAASGILASSMTLQKMEQLAVEHLTKGFNGAATFSFSLTGSHGPEVAVYLKRLVETVKADIVSFLERRALNTGLKAPLIEQQVGRVVLALNAKAEHLIDDFTHGMMDNGKMKKDPLVSLVANQTNSPGAVQQLGVGDFSQNAFIQNHHALVEVIDRVMASEEFQALDGNQKAVFRDYADSLKDEAANPNLDAGRLRRWSERLLNFAKEAGLKLAADALAQVLSKIFVG
jgi:hypothetical protein